MSARMEKDNANVAAQHRRVWRAQPRSQAATTKGDLQALWQVRENARALGEGPRAEIPKAEGHPRAEIRRPRPARRVGLAGGLTMTASRHELILAAYFAALAGRDPG